MLVFLAEIFTDKEVKIGLLGLVLGVGIFFIGWAIILFIKKILQNWNFIQIDDVYQKLLKPHKNLLITVFSIVIVDLTVLVLPNNYWTNSLEIIVSLSLAIASSWLAAQIFKNFF
ncbi:hypothetical protein [Nostoc piscinale]|uniref:hypothetical protein n=1 Tax=Nostoc piscinale TaxID=224012 RepID=UPI002FFB9939